MHDLFKFHTKTNWTKKVIVKLHLEFSFSRQNFEVHVVTSPRKYVRQ